MTCQFFVFFSMAQTHQAMLKGQRVLYPNAHWYFALAISVTWVGFSSSYFTKLRQTDIYHHIHGATAGLWMFVLVIEPLLYKYGYIKLHRRIGRIAVYTLVPLLAIGGLKMMQLMVINQARLPTGSGVPVGMDRCLFIGILYLAGSADHQEWP